MITEAVVSGIVNGLLSIVGGLIKASLSSLPNKPDFQFGIPEPLWFMVSYVLLNVTLIYPFVLSYKIWREIKA